ncbi:MAG: D-alanyl-D-alanine carboxypeptidase [Lachnospiraceae bacterium]|nr:D-alanyl-D-alanine carboxypeptidase [Lachnospiraceae bacterium]
MRHTVKKTMLFLLTFVLFVSCWHTPVSAQTKFGREDHAIVEPAGYVPPSPPTVNSDTAILVELNSGVILYKKNMHQRMFPASITKIMTALLTLETCSFDDELLITHESVTDLVWGGADSQGRFYEGQKFTVRDGLYALCLDSVNTVGYALAQKIDGSLEGFAGRMNARAQELGTLNTTFTNPHGLNDDAHLTTAYDMTKILWGAIENDDYRVIAGTKDYVFSDAEGHEISCHHNYGVLQDDSPYYDWRVVCGKTGYTSDSMFTRAVYATDGNLDLICVTFHADTTELAYQDVKALLDYGFNNYSLIDVPTFGTDGTMEAQLSDPVKGVDSKVLFTAGDAEVITGAALLVPNTYRSYDWNTDLTIENGKFVGTMSLGGVDLVRFPVTMTVTEENWTHPSTAEPSSENRQGEESESENETARTRSVNSFPETEGDTEEEGKEQKGSPILNVTLLILLVAALVLIGLLFLQNHSLKKRLRRKKDIRG